MHDRLELSLILVSYHSETPLREFFASLAAHPVGVSHEVIVVDNAPGDGTGRWLAGALPWVRVLPMTGNVGYARAVNAGIEQARGEHLLVINPDVLLADGAIDEAMTYLRAHPEAGLIGVQLLDPDGTVQRNARRFYSLTTILLRRTPLGRLWPEHPELRRHLMLDDDLSRPGPVDWVTGAFMLVRREALDTVGPMDGRFFLYFEDVDWCYRMWEGGFEVHLLPDVQLVHGFQRSSHRLNRSLVHHVQSFLSFYDKWGALVYVAERLRGVWRTAAAVLADLLALNLAFLVAFVLRRLLDPFFPQPVFDLVHYGPLVLLVNAVSLIVLPLVGRYRSSTARTGLQSGLEALRATFFVTLVVMAAVYLSYSRTFSRAVILLFVPLFPLALALTSSLRDRVLGGARRTQVGGRRAMVIGERATIETLTCSLHAEDPRDRLVGSITLDAGGGPGEGALGSLDRLVETVERYRVNEILIDGRAAVDLRLRATARALAAEGVEILVDQPWAAALGPSGDRRERWGRDWWRMPAPAALGVAAVLKSVVDRPLGLLLWVVALPGHLLCSTAGRWSGLARARRLERLGQKRRRLSWTEWTDRHDRALPGVVQAPLFWQVVTGRMSLVGPYPLPPGCEEELGPVELLRFAVKPGLAGPWQRSSGRGGVGAITRDDLPYLEQWSLALDADLFLSAVPRLLLSDERWDRVVKAR